MAINTIPTTPATVGCCPSLEPCVVCDTLDIGYRLPFRPVVMAGNRQQVVPVEVTLRFRITRCSGPLSLGDLLYTTTLLPGEKVRLFSSDRHTRFSFDSETNLSYHNQTTSEESYYLAGMAYSMSNLSMLDTTHTNTSFSSSSVSGGGGAGIDLGIVSIGGSASGSSYDANGASTVARQLTQHAESSNNHMEVSTRAASSTSIGEVATRTHQQGESEDQYESASRTFTNPNRCHAVTFLFYRINKCQTVRFELVGIDRRVDDPLMPTGAALNPAPPATSVAVLPSTVLATGKDRLDVAQRAQASVAVEQGGGQTAAGAARLTAATAVFAQAPIALDLRKAALAQVDKDLVTEGLLDQNGNVSPGAAQLFSWEKTSPIPTPGVLVKGCLDDCDICEPELQKERELELTRMDLENQLLKRKIDLLDKAQEYRCCPADDDEPTAKTGT
ncbi:MAG TPA: hypothetical protein VKZ50_22175 [bacterium]|nr:hypothetical protein [bacterium]